MNKIEEAYLRTLNEILKSLSGDPVARAENHRKVELMRQREERGEEPNRDEPSNE